MHVSAIYSSSLQGAKRIDLLLIVVLNNGAVCYTFGNAESAAYHSRAGEATAEVSPWSANVTLIRGMPDRQA